MALVAAVSAMFSVACQNHDAKGSAGAKVTTSTVGAYRLSEAQASLPLFSFGERVLTLEHAAQLLGPAPRRRGGPTEEQRREDFVQSQVQLELLEVEARREGIYDRPELQSFAERAMVAGLVHDLTTPPKIVTEAEARVFYERHPERFLVPARAQAFHIVVADVLAAEMLTSKLGQEPTLQAFMDLAGRESLDRYTKDRGGRLPTAAEPRALAASGYTDGTTSATPRALPDSVVAAIFDAKDRLGLLSEPVRSDKGVHLIFVANRSPQKPIPFEATKKLLIEDLQKLRAKEAVDEVVDGLINTQDVTRNLSLLDQL